ncbi:MAG: hypothetical protein JWR69_2928 [Pedosphaera sp.]|nr:hypothetical protein [Pedosphaera sp.]
MEKTIYLKCKCGSCGEIIGYLSTAVGQTVECPQCKEKSQLPDPSAPTPVELSEPEPKPLPKCAACGAVLDAEDPACGACAKHRRRLTLVFGVAAALILLGLGSLVLVLLNRPAKKAPATTMLIAQPQTRPPKSINDLKVGRFALQPKRGDTAAIATGDVQNVSGNVHLRVKVDLDLLDAKGVKIGSVSDLITVFNPRANWRFLAAVSNPKATSVRFASIKEDQ